MADQRHGYHICKRSLRTFPINQFIINPTKFFLNRETEMPAIGVSVEHMQVDTLVREVVHDALEAGYRMFYTSPEYNNEKHLFEALTDLLPKYKLTRANIFIATKLTSYDFGFEFWADLSSTISYENLGSEYIDLIIMTVPHHLRFFNEEQLRVTWSVLVRMYHSSKVRALGVSNFNAAMLEQLMTCCHGVKPVVNMIDSMPYCAELRLYEYCQEQDVLIQVNGLFSSKSSSGQQHERFLLLISSIANHDPREVLMYWLLKRNIAVITRSTTVFDMLVNKIPLKFELDDNIMMKLDNVIMANWY